MYPPFTLLYVQPFLINTLILLFHNFVQYNQIKAYTTLLIFFTPNVARFKHLISVYVKESRDEILYCQCVRVLGIVIIS